jgi:hypothetical protein
MLIQAGADLTWDLSNTSVKTSFPRSSQKKQHLITSLPDNLQFRWTSIFDCVSIWGATDQAWVNIDTLTLFSFSLYNSQRYQKQTTSLLLDNLGFTADIGSGNQPAVVVYNHRTRSFIFL